MSKTKQRIVNLRGFLINKHNYIFQNVIEEVINQTLKEVEEVIDEWVKEKIPICPYDREWYMIDSVMIQELKKELGLIENE